MNRPLRRLAGVVALLFVALFASTTHIQFVSAEELKSKPGNSRQLYAELGRDRGLLLVGPDAVAIGEPVDDPYKFLRTYPDGPAYAHTTGYYSIRYGTAGMERAMNDVLAGTADRLFYRRVSEYLIGEEPKGASVELTIDPRAQRAAVDALGDRRGAVVALDPETGDVLALVSSPSYDPNRLASHDVEAVAAAWRELNEDPSKPMLNRGISELYPPGSTFKVVTAAAALSSGDYQPDSVLPGPAVLDLPLTDKGLPNHSSGPCGPGDRVTLTDALRTSCNTAFGQLGMDLGEEALREQAARFGFGEELGIPLRVAPSSVPEGMNAPQLAQAGIGQFDVKTTPLQMAMVSAAIANEGVLMKPNLVKSVRSADQTEVIDEPSPQELGRAVDADVAEQLAAMMRTVVEDGTGTRARIPGVEVAGKTGTAQHGGEFNHAWFTAFASGGERRVAVAVVIEDGGGRSDASGGATAAPVARQVMEAVVSG